MPTTPSMVIVGAGHCGGRAAQALREFGWTGGIDLIGMERHPPYERPPLSKELLTGRKTADACLLRSSQAMIDDDIHLHTQRLAAIDTQARTVTLANRQVLPYRKLLLATGGTARSLDIPGAELPEVLTLRTLDDALTLAPRLNPATRLLVVGGGFIGLEVAASARSLGCRVTLLEGGQRLLGRAVPADLAQRVQALHREQGVEIRLGLLPEAIERSAQGALRVRLNDGSILDVDAVVVGIGMKPATRLAREAGLAVASGIVVDAGLQTSAPGVFAAGDVAEFPCPLSGQATRQESWFNAEMQARVAACNMLGGDALHHQLPWFWSEQYDHQLQVCGEPALACASVSRELGNGDRVIFHLNARNQLVGMDAWGLTSRSAREFKLARLLVERRLTTDPRSLADPALSLKSLLSNTTVAA
jgi:3-phenylpropionate/trans-cinnamate dioxygenase ferredoxin reductase component